MRKLLPFIGGVIILGGILLCLQLMVNEYIESSEKYETNGSPENLKMQMLLASDLAQNGRTKDAIDLMIKTIAEHPEDLTPQLKLAQIYAYNCKTNQENCEDALWQLNVILEIDSTNTTAKIMLKELEQIISPKTNVNNQYKE